MCPPNNNPPIFIAFTSANFVIVWLKDPLLFPAPILQIEWEVEADPEALELKKKYAKFFDLTETLKAEAPPNKYKDY